MYIQLLTALRLIVSFGQLSSTFITTACIQVLSVLHGDFVRWRWTVEQIFYNLLHTVTVWLSGNALVSINTAALRPVSNGMSKCLQPSSSTQPGHPSVGRWNEYQQKLGMTIIIHQKLGSKHAIALYLWFHSANVCLGRDQYCTAFSGSGRTLESKN